MLLIQKLVRPGKHSGWPLEPGKTTKVRGLTVTNTGAQTVYVDKWARKKGKSARKKK